MRFGACVGTDVSKIDILKKYGYDYVEMSLAGVSNFSDEKIAEVRAKMDETGIYLEATNGFFGFPESYLVSDQLDLERVEEYTRRALGKATKLGLKVAVLGCGDARRIPEDVPYELAVERFVSVLKLVGKIADEFDVDVVIEPLQAKEANYINTVQDGLDACALADHPRINVLADFFHVAMSGESLDAIRTCGDKLKHCHIARDNPDRTMPINPEDLPACREWAAALKENGYDARISMEGKLGDDFDLTAREMVKTFEIFK